MEQAQGEQKQTGAPQIRTYQFDSKSVGDIKKSVNIFRGDVNFSETLVSLKGRNGLDVNVTMLYQGNVHYLVNKSNAEFPTGIAGLGWDLPYDCVYRNTSHSYSAVNTSYTLKVGGSAHELVRTKVEIPLFELPSDFKLLPQNGGIDVGIAEAFGKNGLAISPAARLYSGHDNIYRIVDSGLELEYKLLLSDSGIGVYDGGLFYETKDYQFWKIVYYPSFEKWEIVKEDGFSYTFGGGIISDSDNNKTSSQNQIQWGVKWGNWIGNSALIEGQEQYPIVWNIHTISNLWGDTVNFEYRAVEQKVGGEGGKNYTKACYLDTITDIFGRKIIFFYEEKDSCEYTDTHKADADNTPNAYQDKYETKFLDCIQVHGTSGKRLFSIQFEYETKNVSDQYQNPKFTKRYLTTITRRNSDGKHLPGIDFAYNWTTNPEQHRGSISEITYPNGGVVTYQYEKIRLSQCNRSVSISDPWQRKGTPRVWYGSDYAVVIWYNEAESLFRLSVFSWVGKWYEWLWLKDGSVDIPQSIDMESLNVAVANDFFAVSFKVYGMVYSENKVLLFHKNVRCSGQWYTFYEKAFRYDDKLLQFVTGDSFVIVYNASMNQEYNKMIRFSWDMWLKVWIEQELQACPEPDSTDIALTAGNKYYIIMECPRGEPDCNIMKLFYRDGQGQWHDGAQYSPVDISMAVNASDDVFFQWASGEAMAAFGFISRYYGTEYKSTCDFNLDIFQWNEDFSVITQYKAAGNYRLFNSVLPWLSTVIVGDSLVAGGPLLYRFNGQDWQAKELEQGVIGEKEIFNWYAYGDDIALSSRVNEILHSPPDCYSQLYQPQTDVTAWNSPPAEMPYGDKYLYSLQYYPTVGKDYITVDKNVFYRGVNWEQPEDNPAIKNPVFVIPGIIDTRAIINMAPEYFVALQCDEEGSPASTKVYYLSNGTVVQSEELTMEGTGEKAVYYQVGQSVEDYIEKGYKINLHGKVPAKNGMFTLYPAGEKFEQAATIQLNKYIGGKAAGYLEDFSVNTIEINDGYTNDTTSYQYDAQTALADPSGIVTKYYAAKVCYGGDAGKFGYTAHNYFNGIMQELYNKEYLSAFEGEDKEYYNLLDGMLYKKENFNRDGQSVEAVVTSWKAYTKRSDGYSEYPLYNGYVRMTAEKSVKDAVESTTVSAYSLVNGQVIITESTNYNGSGAREQLKLLSKYLFEEYDGAIGRNLIIPVIQQTSLIDEKITGVKVQTWKRWEAGSKAGTEAVMVLAPWQSYALKAYTEEPDFPFNTTEVPEHWAKLSQTEKLTGVGMPLVTTDADGVKKLVQYDELQMNAVAAFVNSNEDEVLYSSFEQYENTGNWKLDANALIVENEAHCGRRSVAVNPGQFRKGLAAGLLVEAVRDSYMMSFWYKTSDGFASDTGSAGCYITINDMQKNILEQTVQIVDTQSVWQYAAVKLSVPKECTGKALGFDIIFDNQKASQSYKVDDIRFTPFLSQFQGFTYDIDYSLTVAQVGSNRETGQYIYDQFQRNIAVQGPDENISGLSSNAYSRQINGCFQPDFPNCTLKVASRNGGFYYNFNSSPEWQKYFLTEYPQQFIIKEGTLQYLGQEQVSLAIKQPYYQSNYSVSFAIEPVPQTETYCLDINQRLTASSKVRPVILNKKWELYRQEQVYAAVCRDDTGFKQYTIRKIESDVGVRIGKQFLIQWNSTLKQWELYDYNISNEPLRTSPCPEMNITNWLIVVSEQTILFYGDGLQIFGYNAPQRVAGSCSFLLSQPVMLSNIIILKDPVTSIEYMDGSDRTLQKQQLVDGKVIVSAAVYDTLGNVACETKPAELNPEEKKPVLSYRRNFAVMDWETGKMSGEISDYYSLGGGGYSEDEGYPFVRNEYDASLLNRVIAVGNPGGKYAINPAEDHYQKISYSSNTGNEPVVLPKGEYFVKTAVYQNNGVHKSISDKCGNIVADINNDGQQDCSVSSYEQAYLFAPEYSGCIKTILPPNWYAPPQGQTSREEMKLKSRYDLLGNLVEKELPDSEKQGQKGIYSYIHTTSGKLRFAQGPEGSLSADPYILFWTYDMLSRVIMAGIMYYSGDMGILRENADKLQWLPPDAIYTAVKEYIYDCNPEQPDGNPRPEQVGKMVQIRTYNPEDMKLQAVESFDYDIRGKVSDYYIKVPDFSDQIYHMHYVYSISGDIAKIVYPLIDKHICYTYDNGGRVYAIGTEANPAEHAMYTYTPDGKISTEIINTQKGVPVEREYRYNSPGWVIEIKDNYYHQTLDYSENGYDGAGYYNGEIARSISRYPRLVSPEQFPAQYGFEYKYDTLGRLLTAKNTVNDIWSIGIASPTQYDANSNILAINYGEERNIQYNYQPATNKVLSLQGGESECYKYDANGSVVRVENKFDEIKYNRFSCLASEITGTDGEKVSFAYGGREQRILKAGPQRTKLYLHGTNSYPLLEITLSEDNSLQVKQLIYGQTGLMKLCDENGQEQILLKDHQNSTRVVIDSSSCEVSAAYAYSPFGSMMCTPYGHAEGIDYLYTGQEYDCETGLYNYRSRLYDTNLRRFYSLDSKGQFFSPYLYVGNNPISMVDPDGNLAFSAMLLIVGICALVGTAAGFAGGGIYGAAKHHKGSELFTDMLAGAGIGFMAGAAIGIAAVGGAAAGAALGAPAVATAMESFAAAVPSLVASAATGALISGTANLLVSGVSAAVQGQGFSFTNAMAALGVGSIAGAVGGAAAYSANTALIGLTASFGKVMTGAKLYSTMALIGAVSAATGGVAAQSVANGLGAGMGNDPNWGASLGIAATAGLISGGVVGAAFAKGASAWKYQVYENNTGGVNRYTLELTSGNYQQLSVPPNAHPVAYKYGTVISMGFSFLGELGNCTGNSAAGQ